MKQLLCLVLLICFLFTACKKPEPDAQKTQPVELTINKTTLTLSGKAVGMDSIFVQSNSKWNLTVSANTAGWLKTSVTNGAAGTTKVYITVLQPNKTGTARTATLQITSEADPTKIVSIEITQNTFAIEPWSKLYGGTHADIFDAILPTADSGYLMVGGAESSDGDLTQNRGNYDGLIVKVAQDGTIVWQKSYGGSNYERFFSIISNGKGGYMLAGVSYSSDGDLIQQHRGNGDVWLMELDANGNKLWQKTYGGSGSDYANSIIRTPDGGYMVQASSWSEDGDITRHVSTMQYDYDWWIFKIDASGNKVWDRNFGGSALDIASNIIAVNGGYLITGATKSSDYDAVGSHGDDDGLVIKIDESGNEIWSHVYGGAASDGFFAVIPTQDGGFLFTGNASSTDGDVSENKGAADAWVVKTDENGAIVWQKTFGGSGQEDARFVIPTSNGGYLIAGSTQSSSGDVTSNQGSYDGWVLTLDASGNKVWQKSYGGSTNEWFTLICKGADGFYVGVGSTDSNNGDCIGNHGSTEAWAVKFNIQ